jgi:hypothetical protein
MPPISLKPHVSHFLGLFGQRREDLRLCATALHPFAARVEVDLPARELGSEANVLPISPDRQRELIFVDHCLNRLRRRVAEHARDLGRREGELRKALGIRRPRHDVDPLAVELVHNGLHARALEADARANRIDRVVAREHGDLRAATDLARSGPISTMFCWISGTSSLNSACTNSGSPRLRIKRGPWAFPRRA